VLGISTDTQASHKAFARKYSLPYPLLADTEGEMSLAYGTLKSPEPHLMRARRVSFLINEEGMIEKIWDPVSAAVHNEEVLSYLAHVT
jgi:thioredoxin-dependent peroxiredoxin